MTSPDLQILASLRFKMAFWEFLIQKEGDRSWLPLESSKVEVLEGRYRIVAHSKQPNMPIEIRITHDATTEIPPIRRTQKRFSRTNKNGLVVVMPFTRLLPGVWDLHCASDLMAEMLGQGWQYAVRLQVLPIEIETYDEWEPDWPAGDTNAEPIAHSTASLPQQVEAVPKYAPENIPEHTPENIPESAPENILPESSSETADRAEPSPTPANSVADSVLEGTASDLLPLAPPSSPLAPAQTADLVTELTPSGQVPSAASVRLHLEQDAYVIQTGQPLTLIGRVEAVDGQSSEPFPLEALQVRLYDPRTSQVLIEERQPLTTRTLPFPFTCRITLPDHFQTYLVLGEIILSGTTAEGTTSTLAIQPFNVTTDLHELLEAIANDFAEADMPLPANAASESKTGYATDIAALEPDDSPVAPIQFRPAPQQPLPPQLRPADPNKTWQSLNLPSFYEAEAATSEPPEEDLHFTATEPALASTDLTNDLTGVAGATEVANLPGDAISSENPPGSELLSPETAELPPLTSPQPLLETPLIVPQAFDNHDPIPDWDKSDPDLDEPQSRWSRQNQPIETQSTKPESPEEIAFRSLNLQERFWTRLQALVADRELSEWLGTFDDGEFAQPVRATRRSEERDAALTRHEVVVEDELPTAPEIASENNDASPDEAKAPSSMPVLSIQQPIPVPQLDIATGELTAGQLLNVQAKLPDLSYPLFVKLWLVDRQNRSVLEGPYWLTDFAPNGFGDLVSRYELTVPHGCLELQFEAIAVEMTTQRESDKATVSRQVVPPNLSNLALDELDV